MRSKRIWAAAAFVAASLGAAPRASALELDWNGAFRSDFNFVWDYSMDTSATGLTRDATRDGQGGYYVPGGGSQEAIFGSLFLKLQPKLVVNDNIYIKSEWWVGDPVFGLFGSEAPYTFDQRQYYSTQSRGSLISAQRVWAEMLTDIGTVQLGRMPLNWGLGLVWNAGDGIWDRYESTADAARLVAKFGSFAVIPTVALASMGNNVGGSCLYASQTLGTSTPIPCSSSVGSGSILDVSFVLKYENIDDDIDAGANIIFRRGGTNQDTLQAIIGSNSTGTGGGNINYNIYDLYGRKKLGRFTLAGELPISSGSIAGVPYTSFAVAGEAGVKLGDHWDFSLKGGHAPGESPQAAATPTGFSMSFFNPGYQVGLIMFNYALQNFAGPNSANNPVAASQPESTLSAYDNPVTNANYFVVGAAFHTEKWNIHGSFIYGLADQAAVNTEYFLNTQTRTLQLANGTQGNALGFEGDIGATFHWDEYLQAGVDFGLFMPGSYFAFSNTATPNALNPVIAGVARVGITF